MTDIAPVEAPAPDTPPPLEGKALVDQIASEMGWRDKDKFKGDPEKWQDSDAFLRATPAVLKSAKEASERSARAAAQTIERIQRQAIADAEAKIAEVVQANIEAGRLLPANVQQFARHLAAGNAAAADALLGDYTGAAQRAGSSFAAGTKPVTPAKPARNATEIVAEIAAEGKLKPGTGAFVSEMYARIGKAREAGTFVENT